MKSNIKTMVAAILAVVSAGLSLALFIGLCWTAAADAQGAIAFFIYTPVLVVLTGAAFFLARYSSARMLVANATKKISVVLAIFYVIFYVSPFIGAEGFSTGVIDLVARSFHMVTGKTPMQWDKNL